MCVDEITVCTKARNDTSSSDVQKVRCEVTDGPKHIPRRLRGVRFGPSVASHLAIWASKLVLSP